MRCRDLAAAASPPRPPRSLYYFVLSKTDPSWELAGAVNDFPRWPWWVTVLGLLPLALPAAFAYRLPAPDFGALALRVWPLAGLAVFYQPAGTFPFHAFQGLSLPLAVLAVLALREWLGERRIPLARRGGGPARSGASAPRTARTSCARRSTSAASRSS